MRTSLSIGQIAAQGAHPRAGKPLPKGHQQRSVAVATGAMRKYEKSTTGTLSAMQKSAHRSLARGFVD
jgi:hypothetical protein